MSFNKRHTPQRRHLKARQGPFDPFPGFPNESSTTTSQTSQTTSQTTTRRHGPPPRPTPSTTTTTSSTPAARPSSSSTPERVITTTSTSTEEPSSTTSSSSSSSSSSRSSSSSLVSITPLSTPNFAPTTVRTISSPSDTVDLGAGPQTPTPSETAETTSGSLNTGAIAGGIAGGLAALAVLGFIIAFLLRRWRKRVREDEFDAAQFRRSAMVMDGGESASRPVSIFARAFNRVSVAPSINSSTSAGMAGAGVFKANDQYYADPPPQQHSHQPSPGLQPRQQYTYGQPFAISHPEDDAMNEAHGAYSAEPQAQGVYNLEAYGDYQAYSPDNINYGETTQTNYNGASRRNDDDAYGGI